MENKYVYGHCEGCGRDKTQGCDEGCKLNPTPQPAEDCIRCKSGICSEHQPTPPPHCETCAYPLDNEQDKSSATCGYCVCHTPAWSQCNPCFDGDHCKGKGTGCECKCVPVWEEEAAKTATEAIKLTKHYSEFSACIYQGFQKAIKEERNATLREVMELVEEHDPSTNRNTSPAYWGNTLRVAIQHKLTIELPQGTKDQRKLLRNAVLPELGLHVLSNVLHPSE